MQYQLGAVGGEHYQTVDVRNEQKKLQIHGTEESCHITAALHLSKSQAVV